MKLTVSSVLLLLSFLVFSCDNSEKESYPYPLTFEKDSYEVRLGATSIVSIRSGNQHYTVTVEDQDILEAHSFIAEGTASPGEIRILGKRKGETFIYVSDNLGGDKVKLKIKVTDTYMVNHVSLSSHSLFSENQYLFLIKNDNRDFYIYTMNQSQDNLSLRTKGNYEFLIENNTPFLILNYQDAEEINKTHKFSLSETRSSTIIILDTFFELGWMQKSLKLNSPPVYALNLKEESTGLEVSLTLDLSIPMPEGVLD